MKILMINPMPLVGSGSGVYVINMASALVRQGHEVRCICVENEAYDGSDLSFKVHPIYFTQDDGTKPEVDAPILPFNFPCFTIHPRSSFNYYDLSDDQLAEYVEAFRSAIKSEIDDFQPDLIHGGHIWIPSAVAAEFDVPLVVTCHGTDIISFQRGDRFNNYAEKAAESAAAIVCISQQNLDLELECFPDTKDKAILMPNGYDSYRFFPDKSTREDVLAEYNIDKKYDHLVSFAGKFTHFKGIDILLKAAKQYSDGTAATLLAGDGALFDEMMELKEELDLKDVYFVHNQPYDKLRHLYSAAEVSLAPSRGEPFGLVIIEAGACGTPVVSTNDGGATGILTPETGILIDPEDPDALAQAVKSVISGEKKFDRKHIADYTKQTFSQDSLIVETVKLYQKVCHI